MRKGEKYKMGERHRNAGIRQTFTLPVCKIKGRQILSICLPYKWTRKCTQCEGQKPFNTIIFGINDSKGD